MPCTANVNMLEKVAGSIEASKGVFVIDYLGLSVKETQELRRALREVGAEMKVYKNNIVKIALEKAGLPAIDDVLVGTTACVFYENDPVDAAKVIKEASKKFNKLEFRGGITDGVVVNAEQAIAIADLPSREELYAHIAAAINGVAQGLATAINGVPRGLAQVAKAVADQKVA